MRVKRGSEIISHEGHSWGVVHVDKHSDRVTLTNEYGVKFHVPRLSLKHHGKKLGFWANLFRKSGAK